MSFSFFISIVFIVFSIIIGMLNIFLKVLFWVQLWQEKEYRNDRMHDYFTTISGKKETINQWSVASAMIIFALFLLSSLEYSSIVVRMMTVMSGFGILLVIRETIIRVRRRVQPRWTAKAVVLCVASFGFTIFLSIATAVATTTLTGLLLGSFVTPLLVTLSMLIARPFSQWYYQETIRKAQEKMKTMHPIVIGITGSYGKTSTKEFLVAMLERKYNVIATPKNINADIGIAKVVLERLQPEHAIFIVEMGAYRAGEIRRSCDIVNPTIGVLTGINHQHESLFGSFERLQSAKAELFEALPINGCAVVNADNAWCRATITKTRASTVRSYAMDHPADVTATNIEVQRDRLRWNLHCDDKETLVHTYLAGRQHIPSILAAATVALYCGLSIVDIRSVIAKLTPLPGTMELRKGLHGATIIDDHYNSNPDGFIAALEYLRTYTNKRKIVITRGMYELGTESEHEHRRIGNVMGSVADLVIITKDDFAKPIVDSLKQAGLHEQQIIVEIRPSALRKLLLSTVTEHDVLLIEGRLQPMIFQMLSPYVS